MCYIGPVGARIRVLVLAVAACGERPVSDEAAPGPSALERAIAADLGTRVGAPIYVRCVAPLGVVLACDAVLPDRSVLPVALHDAGSAWEWSIAGRLIASAPIAAYVRDVVQDLGAAQTVTCGPAFLRLAAGERAQCQLERGGLAFVAVGSDGALAVEVELDPAAAAARAEPAHATELDGMSRALAPGSDAE